MIHNQKHYLQRKRRRWKQEGKISEDIKIVSSEIHQTLSVIENLKKSYDEIGFCAEKKTVLGNCPGNGLFLFLSLG